MSIRVFFVNDTSTTEIYTRPYTLSLHDALPICGCSPWPPTPARPCGAQRSSCCRSEEHTSELQSHGLISYAVFCLKKNKNKTHNPCIHLHPTKKKKQDTKKKD